MSIIDEEPNFDFDDELINDEIEIITIKEEDDIDDNETDILILDEEIIENEKIIEKDVNCHLKSINFLTKYEKINLLSIRAKQISNGSKIFVKYNITETPLEIAKKELEQKKIPFKIKRTYPNGYFEYFKID